MDLRKFNSILIEESYSRSRVISMSKQIKNCMNDAYEPYKDGTNEFIMDEFMSKVKANIDQDKLKEYIKSLSKKLRKPMNVRNIGSEYLEKLREKE